MDDIVVTMIHNLYSVQTIIVSGECLTCIFGAFGAIRFNKHKFNISVEAIAGTDVLVNR